MPILSCTCNGRPVSATIGGIFEPSKSFQSRQAVRDEYQGLADNVRSLEPTLPASIKSLVARYLPHISSVIARGATASDLIELKAKIADWEAIYQKQETTIKTALPGGVPITVSPDLQISKQPIPSALGPGLIPDLESLKATFAENPVLIVVALGAIFYLLKR